MFETPELKLYQNLYPNIVIKIFLIMCQVKLAIYCLQYLNVFGHRYPSIYANSSKYWYLRLKICRILWYFWRMRQRLFESLLGNHIWPSKLPKNLFCFGHNWIIIFIWRLVTKTTFVCLWLWSSWVDKNLVNNLFCVMKDENYEYGNYLKSPNIF